MLNCTLYTPKSCSLAHIVAAVVRQCAAVVTTACMTCVLASAAECNALCTAAAGTSAVTHTLRVLSHLWQ